MLGYRKKSFAMAHSLLHELRANLKDLEKLRILQRLLVREILRTEAKNRIVRARLKAVQANTGGAKRKQAASLKNSLKKIRRAAYIWRSFGDAIAFSYMDKFALKQCFYSQSMTPKQSAGFLSDKSGFNLEIRILEAAIDAGIPALLTDITNTIRYGDVCLMGGNDPVLFEIKSSSRTDRRGIRQRKELAALHEFYTTDRAEQWRGSVPVLRVAFEGDEISYADKMESTIATAFRDGHCVTQPEPGLYYVALADGAPVISDVLDSLHLVAPWLFTLNELKNELAWQPYYPFTLSFSDRDHLWAFIRGDVFVIVVFDIDRLRGIVEEFDACSQFDFTNREYPLLIDLGGEQGWFKVSTHILSRIGLEFVSPQWLIEVSMANFKKGAVAAKDFEQQRSDKDVATAFGPNPAARLVKE